MSRFWVKGLYQNSYKIKRKRRLTTLKQLAALFFYYSQLASKPNLLGNTKI